MPIKLRTSSIFIIVIFLLLTLSVSRVHAQAVWENTDNEIYNFLSRQAQKGTIVLDDQIQPITRKEISRHLDSLEAKRNDLTPKEQKELTFYRKEYSEFNVNLKDSLTFLRKDEAQRWRVFGVKKDGFILRAEPVLGIGTIQGSGQNIFRTSNGLSFWGQAGKHFGFQFYFRDITEHGTGIDSLRQFTPEPGIVRAGDLEDPKSINYSDLRGYVSYSWKNGSIAIGKDQLLWGYGQTGRVVLSDKAPAYPFIRLDYRPLKWLGFEYHHAWLQSGVLDSAQFYSKGNGVYGNEREFFVPKFMASHTLSFYPWKGLSLFMGESIVYSDQLEIGYLIPIMFFKAYDQYVSRYNINAGSNGQFFFGINSRNNIPKTQLYGSLFIDEIRLSTVTDQNKSRNQLGFTIGGKITDVLLSYLTLGVEYTRINPFVYDNIIPAQTYTSETYSLGDWMGNNADRFTLSANYTPVAKLKTSFYFQKIRKGGPGTLDQQYFAEPQPDFLFDHQKDINRFNAVVSYELINKLYIRAAITIDKQKDYVNSVTTTPKQAQLGISYGW
ncbi:hypothetical protein GS399_12125 [Pedobacter sp. HMF7647]|uniref:Capsule assembly Wzi family protein n=2 Tax=Hufsiella arboris TaxID=2695275 RepID=A0A7K1YAW7_9SPHI|nr:hypothetical protein [Hufsiella arboris]